MVDNYLSFPKTRTQMLSSKCTHEVQHHRSIDRVCMARPTRRRDKQKATCERNEGQGFTRTEETEYHRADKGPEVSFLLHIPRGKGPMGVGLGAKNNADEGTRIVKDKIAKNEK